MGSAGFISSTIVLITTPQTKRCWTPNTETLNSLLGFGGLGFGV